MKKNVCASVFPGIPIIIVSLFSCWSPFQPVTHIGQDVISAVDSNATNLKAGFKMINGINLTVNGARSVISPGSDTNIYQLTSGDLYGFPIAGRSGDDSATMYAEFQLSVSDLAKYKTGCDSAADSIRMVLRYDTLLNSRTSPGKTEINVFLCARKYFPHTQNGHVPVSDFFPVATIPVDRSHPDSFFVKLGPKFLAQLNAAIKDSTVNAAYSRKVDTLYGAARVVCNDSAHNCDTFPDTIIRVTGSSRVVRMMVFSGKNIDSVFSMTSQRDTAGLLVRYSVKTSDTANSHDTVVAKTDTVAAGDTALWLDYSIKTSFHSRDTSKTDSANNDTVSKYSIRDTAIISYTVAQFQTLHVRFKPDSVFFDSSKKFIGAVSVCVTGGAIVRFNGPPNFQVFHRPSCPDTPATLTTYSNAGYYDAGVTEVNAIPSDSLMTSWQANRYLEIPISLSSLWDSAKIGNREFKIVQTASCSLYTDSSHFEHVLKADSVDTSRTIYFGLLGQAIPDEKYRSRGTYDSLAKFFTGNLIPLDSAHQGSTGMRLSMSKYLQNLADMKPRPATAYLYIFATPVVRFTRIAFSKMTAIKFSALFSNPHQ